MEYDKAKEIFRLVIEKYNNHNKWLTGDFIKVKTLGNSKIGKLGEDFIEAICKELNWKYKRMRANGEYDIEIKNKKYEIKSASEDTSGKFQFNNIRYDYQYDYILCVGVSPNDLWFGLFDKSGIVTGKYGRLVSMGGGQNAQFKLTKSKKELMTIMELVSLLES